MYRCIGCESILDKENLAKVIENCNEYGYGGEVFKVCPHCHDEVEEVEICECGEIIEADEKICEKCKSQTITKFTNFMKTFTEEEKEEINYYLENNEI